MPAARSVWCVSMIYEWVWCAGVEFIFFFSSRRRHTRFDCDWSSDVCSSDLVEKTLYLRQAGGLGFCKQALSRPKTVLGPGDLAQIHTSCSSTSRNSEAIRKIGRASCRERV